MGELKGGMNSDLGRLKKVSDAVGKNYTVTYVRHGKEILVTVWIDETFNRQERDSEPADALKRAVNYIVHKHAAR